MALSLCQPTAPIAALSPRHSQLQNSAGLAVQATSACGIGSLPLNRLRSKHRALERTPRRSRMQVLCAITEEKEGKQEVKPAEDLDAVTRKWGLEAGLFKAFTSKEEGDNGGKTTGQKGGKAKELLARYGSAYLITSITLSLISFTLCYLLVDNGVDVPALLSKIGIQLSETGEKVGTFALAYAAHKAASPIRFPPTVALTPIVAQWFGKKQASEESHDK